MAIYYIYSGETSTGVQLSAGDKMYVLAGGSAYSTTISSGGSQDVSSGGAAGTTYVSRGGKQSVSGGMASTAYIRSGIQEVWYGGSAVSAYVSSGGSQVLYSGGVTRDTVVSLGGSQLVEDGSVASRTTVAAHGEQHVSSGGLAVETTVSAAMDSATQIVSAGGEARGTLLSVRGVQNVYGSAVETSVGTYCAQTVYAGGVASQVQVRQSGYQVVYGSALGTVILDGGQSFVSNGGFASGAKVSSGGSEWVQLGGTASGTIVCKGGSQIVEGSVYGSAVAYGAVLKKGGVQAVSRSGGVASGTRVSSGGKQILSSGALAYSAKILDGGRSWVRGAKSSRAYIYSGGSMLVSSGGSAVFTTVNSGGTVDVFSGGNAVSATVNSGGYMSVSNGGLARGGTVMGRQVILDGGVASKIAAASGGFQYVYGGLAVGTSVELGGRQHVDSTGRTAGARIAGSQDVNGVDSGAVILSGGVQEVYAVETWDDEGDEAYAYGSAIDAVVSNGGRQIVRNEGVASAAIISSGGIQTLFYDEINDGDTGGSAFRTRVKEGGQMRVSYGGSAISAFVSSGGIARVYSGGKAIDLTLKSGGKAYLYGGSLNGTNTWKGADVNVLRAGVKIAAIAADASTTLNYNISAVSAGAATMLKESVQQDLACAFSVTAAKAQQIGTYKLSSKLNVADGTAFSIKLGSTSLGTAKLNSSVLNKYGVTYTLTDNSAGTVSLTLAMRAGNMLKGTTGADTLTGNANSDIFYAGKGNDTVTGTNGRDVAVYDRAAWGQDVIQATSGTMTLLFAGLSESEVTQTKSGTSLVIARAANASQKITVQGWNDATHNIVFTDTLTEFNKYLNAASPTTAQTTAAQNEVWAKAGLAAQA